MHRVWITISMAALLGSCADKLAPDDRVRDSNTAISIGRAQCSEGDEDKRIPQDHWHARLYGDYWRVWQGQRQDGHAFMENSVAKHDGKTTGCTIWVE